MLRSSNSNFKERNAFQSISSVGLLAVLFCTSAIFAQDQVAPVMAPAPKQFPAPSGSESPRALLNSVPVITHSLSAGTRAVNSGVTTWVQQGPTSALQADGYGIPAAPPTPADPQVGSINRLATSGTTILAASVGGGIFRSTNGGATWTPTTDAFPVSMSAVAFDFSDPTIAIAGFGRTSSISEGAKDVQGLLRSTDGGQTWSQVAGAASFPNGSVAAVQSHNTTSVILVAFKNVSFSNDGGIWRSTNNGTAFTNITSVAPLTTGSYTDLVSDPNNAGVYYAAHRGSGQNPGQNAAVFRTTDDGASWTDITSSMTATVGTTSDYIRVSVGSAGVVFVGVVNSGQLAAVYRSTDARTAATPTWTIQGTSLPGTTEMGTFYGIHPGSQGGSQFGMTVDPTDNTVVYVSGDRTPANNENGQAGIQFPNSIGANTYSGSVFRFKAGVWQSITSTGNTAGGEGTASNSAPHADSRDLAFEGATGNLLDACDGGIYRRNRPLLNTGDWTSAMGNLPISEFHTIGYDGNFNVVIGGLQDNGVAEQATANAASWVSAGGGDGGKVAVDDSVAGTSLRYSCSQNWGGLKRRTIVGGAVTDTATLKLLLNGVKVKDGVQFYGPYTINAINAARMVFGTNNVLESADRGDTLADISGDTGAEIKTLVYGGKTGGVDNPDLLYVGSGKNIRLRTTAGGALNVLTTYSGDIVRGIAIDPNDFKTALVADALGKVWMTTDAGVSAFVDITGNLPMSNLQTVAFLPAAGNVRVFLVGGEGGVYASGNGEFNVWNKVGTNLPARVLVYDLKYNSRANVLCIGTLGRGAYTIPNASTIFSGPVLSLTSLTPTSGPMVGGTTVTITGTGFAGTPAVTFDGVAATGVSAVTATSFTCVTPAAAKSGSVDVVVTQGAQTDKINKGFNYVNAPTITSLSPNQSDMAGGATVLIVGTDFTPDSTVLFGAVPATGLVVNSATQITCVCPAGTAGIVQVTVTAQAVKSNTAGYTYLAVPPAVRPAITGISPTSVPAAGGTPITVTGTGFSVTSGTMTLSFDGVIVPSSSITVLTPTSMTLSAPPGKVKVGVTVVASDAGSNSLPFTGFSYTGTADAPVVTVTAPDPDAFNPTAIEEGVGKIVFSVPTSLAVGSSITIGFFVSGTAQAGSDYEALGATSVTITGPESTAQVLIKALPRTKIEGDKTVVLTVNSGTTYLVGTPNSATVNVLDLNKPVISQVLPNSGSTAGGDKVQIIGARFAQGMLVKFGGIPATNVVVVDDAVISATTPPGAAGPVDITVDADGIISTLTAGYTYVAPPTLSSVSPNTGTTAGGTLVTLTGMNYAAGASVTFNGVASTSVTVVNATTITCITPAGSAGPVPVAITVGGLTTTFAAQYIYIAPPVVTSLTPATGQPAGGTAVTILGGNFGAGATVTIGGVAATKVVVVNANTITCVTPAGTGVKDVVVTVSGVTGTLVKGFTYAIPIPVIASVTPNSGSSAGGTTVTISGSNFAAGATVSIGTAAATGVVFVNANTITCVTPAGSGIADVSVIVSGVSGTLKAAFTYVIPNPLIISLSPSIGAPSGGTSVTISGANFAADAVVMFGGNPAVSVVLVDANTLTCVTPAGTGVVDVSVLANGKLGTLVKGFTYVDSNANGVQNTLSLGKIVGKFGNKPSTDSLQVNGNLPIPATTTIAGASVTVAIGDFQQTYVLGANGKSPDKNNQFTLSFKEVNGYTAFKLSIKKQDLFSKLSKLGFDKSKDAIVSVPIAITIDNVAYRFPKLVAFLSRSGSYNSK